jgi:hypothetical protein
MRNIMSLVIPSARLGACAAALAVAICSPTPSNAQVFDDFSDLNDTANPTWTHLSGYVNSTGQTWDASTGQYRMTAPNNGVSTFGFVGSHAGPSFTNVRVSADLVNFVGPPAGAVFGVAARLNGLNGPGQLSGYAYAYEPFAAGGTGEMVLYRVNPGVSITDLGSQQVTLTPNKDYTFVLDIQGTQLHGQVYEIGGGLVAERFATDALYTSGVSGFIAYSQNPIPPVDVTWDNFGARIPEPATVTLMGLCLGGIVLRRRGRGC